MSHMHEPQKVSLCRYKMELAEALKNARSFTFTDAQNKAVWTELNRGMSEFYETEKYIAAATQREAKEPFVIMPLA